MYAFLAGGAGAEVGGADLLNGTAKLVTRDGAGTCPDGPIAEADAAGSA